MKLQSNENTEEFTVLDYAASVRHAITRSISHNEIVRTPVPAAGRAEMIEYLEGQDEVDGVDSASENDGSLDVWGTFEGDDFRIRFV